MDTNHSSKIQAITGCYELIQKHTLESCIESASKLCTALSNGTFVEVWEREKKDECFKDICQLANADGGAGATNVLSALMCFKNVENEYGWTPITVNR